MNIKDLHPDDAIICLSLEENRKIREIVSKETKYEENVCANHSEIAFYYNGTGLSWSEISWAKRQKYKQYPAKLFFQENKFELWKY